jgi:hypothetical protein
MCMCIYREYSYTSSPPPPGFRVYYGVPLPFALPLAARCHNYLSSILTCPLRHPTSFLTQMCNGCNLAGTWIHRNQSQNVVVTFLGQRRLAELLLVSRRLECDNNCNNGIYGRKRNSFPWHYSPAFTKCVSVCAVLMF